MWLLGVPFRGRQRSLGELEYPAERGGVVVGAPDQSAHRDLPAMVQRDHRQPRSLALLFSARETTLADLFTFRKLVEPAAAAAAARTASDEQRERLLDIAPKHYGVQRRFEPSIDFHAAIGRCSNNGVYEVMLTALHDVLQWHTFDEKLSHDDIEATRRSHVGIAKAINAGDSELAAKRMLRHLEQFERVLGAQGRLAEPIIPRQRWQRNRAGQ